MIELVALKRAVWCCHHYHYGSGCARKGDDRIGGPQKGRVARAARSLRLILQASQLVADLVTPHEQLDVLPLQQADVLVGAHHGAGVLTIRRLPACLARFSYARQHIGEEVAQPLKARGELLNLSLDLC